MKMLSPLVLSLMIVACISEDNVIEQSAHDTVYSSSDRSFIIAYIDSQFYVGQTVSLESFDIIPLVMGSEGPLQDHSTSTVRCVSAGAPMTFAVPQDVVTDRQFECNGNQFRIEGCEPQSTCTSYFVSAICPRYTDGNCVPDPDGTQAGAFRYRYRWSSSQGITQIKFDRDSGDVSVSLRRGFGFLSLREER